MGDPENRGTDFDDAKPGKPQHLIKPVERNGH